MAEESEDKIGRRILFAAVPTLIAGGSLAVSLRSLRIARENEERQGYDATTNFNIIQNLWAKDPSFTLFNESTRKLDQPPSPTYMMAIPSKVYWFLGEAEKSDRSNLALLPISYDVILEQVKSGETVGNVEESRLPGSFFAKEGARDMITSDSIEVDEGVRLVVETLPFVLIVATIEYSLVGSEDVTTDRIVTTPLGRYEWTEAKVDELKEYFRDNAKFEVRLPDEESGESVYGEAHRILVHEVENLGPENGSLFGGVAGGYDGILKELNQIVTPHDPLES